MIVKYSNDIEKNMTIFFKTLNEKEKRIYAASEVMKLGHGGTKYISELFSIDPKTIRAGKKELEMLETTIAENKRIRKSGGGRKKN